jgi:hypothetical protein
MPDRSDSEVPQNNREGAERLTARTDENPTARPLLTESATPIPAEASTPPSDHASAATTEGQANSADAEAVEGQPLPKTSAENFDEKAIETDATGKGADENPPLIPSDVKAAPANAAASSVAEPGSKAKSAAGPDTGDPTDGRNKFDWQTRYKSSNTSAWHQIAVEATYTVSAAFIALTLIFMVWRGLIPKWAGWNHAEAQSFRIYGFYAASGLLGGTVFCLKYLYRVVARGYWHEDRRLWRFISPLISMFVAFAIGALIQSKMISFSVQSRAPGIVGTGFLLGYFGDQAVAKLHEIANVLFGTSTRSS